MNETKEQTKKAEKKAPDATEVEDCAYTPYEVENDFDGQMRKCY